MKLLLAAVLMAAAAGAISAQDASAAPASDATAASNATPVTFLTVNLARVPVYELMNMTTSSTVNYFTVEASNPTFVAPLTQDVQGGWHVYQLGLSPLFNSRFQIVADGRPQTWRLDAGNPSLQVAGWAALLAGLIVAAIGVNDASSASPLLFHPASAPYVEMAGAVVGGVGLAVVFSTRPSATRVP